MENDMDRVVVVMSTYNGEKYLREQIDSILNQEGIDIQLVVRDDGSTDETYKILEEYACENRITLLPQSKNIGWKKSFIVCLNEAPTGDYYAFSDQDDVWKPDKLIIGVNELKKQNEKFPNLYVSNSWITDENLNKIRKFRETDIDISTLSPYEIWLHPGIQGGCGQIFNRKAREMVLEIKDYPFGHDSLMERICGLFGTIIYDQEPHFFYRQHASNAIGIEQTLLKRIHNMMKILFAPYDKSTSLAPACFLKTYGDNIPKELQEFLILCRDVHRSFNARIRLIRWKGLKKQTINETIILKCKILIGKY